MKKKTTKSPTLPELQWRCSTRISMNLDCERAVVLHGLRHDPKSKGIMRVGRLLHRAPPTCVQWILYCLTIRSTPLYNIIIVVHHRSSKIFHLVKEGSKGRERRGRGGREGVRGGRGAQGVEKKTK